MQPVLRRECRWCSFRRNNVNDAVLLNEANMTIQRTALVTGADRGLGLALVAGLLAQVGTCLPVSI